MAERSQFFDSTASDQRKYNQGQLSLSFRHSAASNGVSRLDYATPLKCTLMPNASVTVDAGVAMIRGYAYINDSTLTLPAQTYLQGEIRTDRVVTRLDESADVRDIRSLIVRGTAGTSSPPALTRSGGVYDIGLAILKWNGSVLTIEDTRADSSVCGYIGDQYAAKTQVLDGTLAASSAWVYKTDHYEQTITITGVGEAGYFYTPAPAPESALNYYEYGIVMQNITELNKATFHAVDKPTMTINVYIKKEQ